MGKNRKKWIVCLLSLALGTGSLTGCGAPDGAGGGEDQKTETSTKAMGRYLEEEISLPEGTGEVWDMVKLSDGTIRIAACLLGGTGAVWDLQGENWEKAFDLPGEWTKSDSLYLDKICLSPLGDGMASLTEITAGGDAAQDAETHSRCYRIDEKGNITSIPLDSGDDFLWETDYTAQGELLVEILEKSVFALDVETGTLTDKCSGCGDVSYFGVAGNTLYLVGYDGEIMPYDLKTGDPLEADTGLSNAVKQSGTGLDLRSSGVWPICFCSGETEEELFFVTSAGLYRCMKNGSVAEQLLDGKLCSLGSPDSGIAAFEASGEEFYLLMKDSAGVHLLRYTYAKDVASVPDTELRAYTLRENSELEQNISRYQKENPNVYISLEVGVSEGGEVTVSDALRTLGTEIMAGEGPDILILDGMPADSYIEKGLLEDISDVVNGKKELFTNIMDAMEQDGRLYGIPLRFALPMVVGKADDLSSITDLESLADAAERMRAADPAIPVLSSQFSGAMLASMLYTSCSPAWQKDDGTVDQEILAQFYRQLSRIFDGENSAGEEMTAEENAAVYAEYYGALGTGTMELYNNRTQINLGDIFSDYDLAQTTSTIQERQEYDYMPLDGQAENTFQPLCVAGINSTSQKKKEAREFVAYLLGEEAQKANMSGGLPVNENALRNSCEELEEGFFGSGSADNPDDYLEMHVREIPPEDIDRLVKYARAVRTPSLTSSILRESVLKCADDCVTGKCTPEEAAAAVARQVNLQLAEQL